MELKQQLFIIKGMQRDLSESKFSPEYAYENMNIRITAKDDNNLLSVTNEKGNKEVLIVDDEGTPFKIQGTYLGHGVLNDLTIIFTTSGFWGHKVDTIYRLQYKENSYFQGDILFQGDLNFNVDYPIESLCVFENEDIKKIYWIDGLNQARVANISLTFDSSKYVNTSFDFALNIELKELITVVKDTTSSGLFAPGTIQYAFSYYNQYAQETAIFYTSPLNYTSYKNRGGSPEDRVSNSFHITTDFVDKNFDYLRIYSIHRTTLDAVPTVKRVVDLSIYDIGSGKYVTTSYDDNGTSGDVVDPSELLFKGSDDMRVGAMTHKDGTLFLGNITLKLEMVPSNVIRGLKQNAETKLLFEKKTTNIISPEPKGFYPYENTLKYDSQDIKSFKYLEHYRFGIQFQHKSGRWSEAIFLKDLLNNQPVESSFDKSQQIIRSQAKYKLSVLDMTILKGLGFIRARGIVCYPNVSDREVIAQGVLAPTVFNVLDRHSNSPFVQSSWFVRPNAPFLKMLWNTNDGWKDIDNDGIQSLNSKSGYWENEKNTVNTNKGVINLDTTSHGSWSEFRHFAPLPNNTNRNAEIQCNVDDSKDPILTHPFTDKTSAGDIADYVGDKADRFFVDQSIFTFHSPELEFDDSLKTMDSNDLKLRIVGMVPITSNVSDIDIITSSANSGKNSKGFYKEQVSNSNISRLGAKGLNSGILWLDTFTFRDKDGNIKAWENEEYSTGFMVYPWHRNGSLTNDDKPINGNPRVSMLDKKKMSNSRFSYGSHYFPKDSVWNAFKQGDSTKTGVSGVEIFDSNEVTLTKIPSPKYSGLDAINYYGNVDKVITSKSYDLVSSSIITVFNEDNDDDSFNYSLPTMAIKMKAASNSKISNSTAIPLKVYKDDKGGVLKDMMNSLIHEGSDPIRMKYHSTPHAVMALNYTMPESGSLFGKLNILPTIKDNGQPINLRNNQYGLIYPSGTVPFWDKNYKGVHQDVIDSPSGGQNLDSLGYGFLWLAELYNDNVVNRFGGTTPEAIENNLWIPCGEPVLLQYEKDVDVLYTDGDTFYGRYDCLKTHPSSIDDQNGIVDIVSFMVESRINLDGRYDRNRGLINNLTMSPNNFNKMNSVYDLNNNFFNYRSLNKDRFQLNDFRNSIVWSKAKVSGGLTDIWTNINLSSTLDLDGDKGPINALSRFKNEIFAFQDKGVSRILFNSRVLINPSDGVPIEISNSYKVDGKIYLDENIGCVNKWSIKNTESGIYFNDDLNKGIYNFNGETFTNITDKLGFNSYYNDISSVEKWTALDFNNSITFYDSISDDIYFITKDKALAYSEKIGQFVSFYNYENVPLMFNVHDKSFAFKGNKIWEQFAGDYNSFFGETKPYYITVIANQEPHLDKTYTNLNFRADTWDGKLLLDDVTFDKLDIWNEYQHGEQVLYMTKNRQSPLKKRFRIWNVLIPRDRVQKRDRIRNPWVYLKLAMTDPKDYKTELHDIIIDYFI